MYLPFYADLNKEEEATRVKLESWEIWVIMEENVKASVASRVRSLTECEKLIFTSIVRNM
jgi:hypothetical protein